MSPSLNSVVVVAVEVDSQASPEASKGSKSPSLSSSPDFLPDKLGITRKIPGRTMAVPKNPGNNNNNPGFSPPASRYFNHGAQLMINSTAKAVETLQSLPAGTKEVFAAGFCDLTSQLQARISEHLARRREMPAELPDPLPKPNVLHKANRRRGYTGREAVDEKEKDARRAQKQAEREAEATRIENEALSQDLLQENLVRYRETDSEAESDNEVIPSSCPLEASASIQVPATAPTSTRSSMRSRKLTRKAESQHTRDIAAIEVKRQHRKQREAKANRTGTGRTKAAEALAQASQLLDGIELPFRSSQ
jgi:hypothetical protein